MPKLMVDSTKKDGQAENIMDYIISWCLRRASIICKNEKPILYNYCRNMLSILLQITIDDSILFKSVKVWKQEYKIDLWIEVIIEKRGIEEKHALLIENKYYSKIRTLKDKDGKYKSQLEIYKQIFDEYYQKEPTQYKKHYALITCIDRNDPKFSIYKSALNLNFSVYSFYELLGEKRDYEESESEIFNEFWLRWN